MLIRSIECDIYLEETCFASAKESL